MPQHLRTLIKGMLCLETAVRIQSFEEVKQDLHLAEPEIDEATRTRIKPPSPARRRRSPLRSVAMTLALVLLVGFNGALYFWLFQNQSADLHLLERLLPAAPSSQDRLSRPDSPAAEPRAPVEQELALRRVSNPKEK